VACPICGAAHASCPGTLPAPQFIIDLSEVNPMASNMWTSDRRLYLDKDGKVVEADDPARQSLLIAAGGSMPLEAAQRYGLIEVTTEVKAKGAPENKAKAPAANKAKG
jgi:hypothetical protein